MSSNKIIAVIMSVYVKEYPDQLKESIDSLKNQTFDSFDCYIMEDGPLTPELYEVLDSICDDRFIRVRSEKNQGLAVSLNNLLKKILPLSYKYIARMDADDISYVERFSKQVHFLDTHLEVDSCGTYAIEISDKYKPLFYKKMPISHEQCIKFFKKRSCYIHPTVMFRKSFFEKAGLYPTDVPLCEDSLLWMKGFEAGCIFYNIPEYLLYFRVNKFFYKRRRGFRYARYVWKCRRIITRVMCYGFEGKMFGFYLSAIRLLPVSFLKIVYKFR